MSRLWGPTPCYGRFHILVIHVTEVHLWTQLAFWDVLAECPDSPFMAQTALRSLASQGKKACPGRFSILAALPLSLALTEARVKPLRLPQKRHFPTWCEDTWLPWNDLGLCSSDCSSAGLVGRVSQSWKPGSAPWLGSG